MYAQHNIAMIKPGTIITLRPYKTYKDAPENNIPYMEYESPIGRILYFQGLDHNRGNDENTKNICSGFYNVCIITNQILSVGDKVTVKSILGVKFFRMKRMLLVTIMEQGEKRTSNKSVEGFEIWECDF